MARIRSIHPRRLPHLQGPVALRLEYLLQALRAAGQEEFVSLAEADRRRRQVPITDLIDRCEEYAAVVGLKSIFKAAPH